MNDMIDYSIFDPTGNITALVETPVPVPQQPETAAAVMRRHPEVEQVGFVRLGAQPELRMAGGEFCGNASMSAAALQMMKSEVPCGEAEVSLRVSGADEAVRVRLRRVSEADFAAGVCMPPARSISETAFAFGGKQALLPLVRMRGISHIVIDCGTPFFALLQDPKAAQEAVRTWCGLLRADGLGLMFLERDAQVTRLTPLVYVPVSNTLFWENACASGSSAVGMTLAQKRNAPVCLELCQPGGTLRVESDPKGDTLLFGTTKYIGAYSL